MADLDHRQPPWRSVFGTDREAGGAAFSDITTPIELKVGKKQTRTIPQFRYVRAVDPAGNVVALSVSSCRASPEFPDGEDRIGTRARVIETKHRRGWIVVDLDDPASRCPQSRFMLGQQYVAWALAVGAVRHEAHAKHEAGEADAFMARARAEARMRAQEVAEVNRAMMGEIGRTVGAEVAKAMAAEKSSEKGGRDRAERKS
jgi:hypothetical protein